MKKTMNISVIICTRNRVKEPMRCIDSILLQTLPSDEIVVVDSSDSDELSSRIQEIQLATTKLVCIHSNPGMTLQWNIGAKASRGDFVFFLDDDTIPERDFIEKIMDIFHGDEVGQIGGVCGNVISPAQNKPLTLTRWCRAFLGRILLKVFLLPRKGSGRFQLSCLPTYRYGTDKIADVECLPGGATAYRKEVLEKFDFDESLTYMADDDFSYRVSRKYRNMYTPHARILHTFSPTARRDKYKRTKTTVRNYHYIFTKNSPKKIRHRFAFWWSVVGLFILAVLQRDREGLKGLK